MLQMKGVARTHPWDHLYFEQVFSYPVYRDMLRNLPEVDECPTLSGYPLRHHYNLDQSSGFWGDVNAEITSAHLTESLKARFNITRDCYPKAAICLDRPGYHIPPHKDASYKVMSFIIYLPKDESQKMLGTRLLKREGAEFTHSKQLGFFPNIGIVFPVTGESWHEVPPIDSLRATLNICYFTTPDRMFK